MRGDDDAEAEAAPSPHMVQHLRRNAHAMQLGVNRSCQRLSLVIKRGGLLPETPTLRRDFHNNFTSSSPFLQKAQRCCLPLVFPFQISDIPSQPALCFVVSRWSCDSCWISASGCDSPWLQHRMKDSSSRRGCNENTSVGRSCWPISQLWV